MHSYFANLYEIECVNQHYRRTLENISIWDITVIINGFIIVIISRVIISQNISGKC